MSAGTPPVSSQSPVATSPANTTQDASQNVNPAERIILDYFRSRGHTTAEKAFLNEIECTSPEERRKEAEIIAAEELIKTLAVYSQKPTKRGENILKEPNAVLQELGNMGNPPNIQQLLSSIPSVGAEDILSIDPSDKEQAFRELEAWVDGSLDMYRVRQHYWTFGHVYSCLHFSSPSSVPFSFPYSAISILT